MAKNINEVEKDLNDLRSAKPTTWQDESNCLR